MIRLAHEGDAAAIAAIYAPNVERKPASFELVAPDAAQMAARIRSVLERWPWLVLEEGGAVLGYCYAGAYAERAAYQWSATVSVYARDGQHRRGIGRRLYGVLFDVLRRQGVCNAFAGITLPNDASVGLHRAMGFEPVGIYRRVGFKFGAWHDVGWFGCRLDESAGEPRAPLALPVLLAAGELRDLLPPG